jgi:hypothetical protein
MDTIKVKPWHPSQGDHVVINAADFDPAVHQRLDGKTDGLVVNVTASKEMTTDELKAALKALGVSFRANASRETLVAALKAKEHA